MITDEFIDGLPDDPVLALDNIINKYFEFDSWVKDKKIEKYGGKPTLLSSIAVVSQDTEYHSDYVEYFGLFQAYSEANEFEFKYPEMVSDISRNSKNIYDFFIEAKEIVTKEVTNLTLSRIKNKYLTQFGKNFAYEFSKGDLQRVQEIINILRDEISATSSLDEEHKNRLLKRLEKMQSELHKKVSDLDRFWGLVGDAGVVAAKLGENAKPIVDRIKEISEIIWRTQSRAEELPSDTPLALIDTSVDET